MRLILVRHGQTQSNVDQLLDTAVPGADLNQLGLRQADALVNALGHEPIEAIYASTLTRSQQTAAPLANHLGLGVRIHDGIREIAAGHHEMAGDRDSVRTYVDTIAAWQDGRIDTQMPGGETGREFYGRFNAAVEEASAVDVAVLVSHGAAIRCWTAHVATNVSSGFIITRRLSNTGAVILSGSQDDGWEMLTWEGQALGGTSVDDSAHAVPGGMASEQ